MVLDRKRWAQRESYMPAWADRSRVAAELISPAATVLEIGAGVGSLRGFLPSNCSYVGTDLFPLEEAILQVDIERDPLPPGQFDFVVALGVLEYLSSIDAAVDKLCGAADNVIVSYCFRLASSSPAPRAQRGWISDLSEPALYSNFRRTGFGIVSGLPYNGAADFRQEILLFSRRA